MDQRLTPELFCGSAIAALAGLLFGLLLHVPWAKHPGGPQILFSTAQAAEPVRPLPADAAAAAPAPAETAALDTRYGPPAPLPVVRLRPDMFDVQPAAAGEAGREDIDDLLVDAAPPAPPGDFD
jgi:hypothetical protein